MVYVFFTRFGILLVFLYSLLASFLWYCDCYCCFIFGFVMVDSFSLCSPMSANVIGCVPFVSNVHGIRMLKQFSLLRWVQCVFCV